MKFKQYLLETGIKLSMKPKNPVLEAFMADFIAGTSAHPFDRQLRIWNDAVGLSVYPFDGRIHFATIMTFTEKNKGSASNAIKWLTALADKHQVEMDLEPVPIKNAGAREGKNLNKTELTAWYKRLGFTKPEHGHLIRRPIGKTE